MSILRVAVALVILGVWAIVYLMAAFSHGTFDAPPELSGVMVATITYLLGSAFRRDDHGPGRFARAAKILLTDKEPADDEPPA